MTYTLTGLIKTTDGATVSISLLVRAYSIALGSRTPIGASRTASRSMTHVLKSYEITWDATDNEPVNVQLSVHLPDGTWLGETELLTAIPQRLKQSITISEMGAYEAFLTYIATDFGRLKTELRIRLSDLNLNIPDLTAADILLLENSFSGEEELFTAASITRLVASERLAAAHDLPAAFFFGIAVVEPRIAMELAAFLAYPDEDLQSKLVRQIDSQVIPPLPEEELYQRIAALRDEQTTKTTTLLAGSLRSRSNESPLAGLRVRAFAAEDVLVGEDFSDADGSFLIIHEHPVDDQPSYELKVFSNEEVVFEVSAFDPENATLYFDLPPWPDTSPPVATLEPLKGIGETTVATLQAQGINSLKDIRQNRAALEDIREDIREKVLGISEMNLLGNLSPEHAQTMLEAGFRNIHSLASADRMEVVTKLGETLGEKEATTTWNNARNADAVLTSIAADVAQNSQTNAPNNSGGGGSNVPDAFQDLLDLYPERCGCDNCENAVSRTAYLTDLLGYALQKVKIGDRPLTFADLTEHFYQPFAELPADCHANSDKVRQVRIGIEVLWAYLEANGLAVTEAEYQDRLWKIYEHILEESGTSYYDLRDARVPDAGEEGSTVTALLDQLDLSYDEDDPRAAFARIYTTPDAISEQWLEANFGWRDTRRPPLEATPAPAWIVTSRRERLRDYWLRADRTDKTLLEKRLIIDPDLIGLAYLVDPLQGSAADLWHERERTLQTELDRLRSLRDNATDDAAAFAAILPVEDLEEWKPAEEEEEEAEPVISDQAFDYLSGIQKLIGENSPITEDEWGGVFAILVQYRKEQELYAIWRTEEAGQDISLTPTVFQIPSTDYGFPPEGSQALPAWRASRGDLRKWEDLLAQRIEDWQKPQTELSAATGKVAEAQLPELRRLLIETTAAPGADHYEKAQWLTEHLLIDVRMAACQLTTRTQQAVEALQLLLWSLRTRQLTETHPDWTLQDDNFDGKWKWLGEYARWRSALLVYLFPENVLQPSLRRWQTPVFREIVERTRRNGRFSPGEACEVARIYSDYLEDLSHLEPVAAASGVTNFTEGDCFETYSTGTIRFSYFFARGEKTGKIYWIRQADKTTSDVKSKYWHDVPHLNQVIEVIGATSYAISEEERYIYLFVKTKDSFKQKLEYLRYDLIQDEWESSTNELELPEGVNTFSAVVKQQNWGNTRPTLAIRLWNKSIHVRTMNREGEDWETKDWRLVLPETKGKSFGKLSGMISYSSSSYILITEGNDAVYYRFVGEYDDGRWRKIAHGEFAGGVSFENEGTIYCFIKNDSKYYSIEPEKYKTTFLSEGEVIDKLNKLDVWLIEIAGVSLDDIKIIVEGSDKELSVFQFMLDRNWKELGFSVPDGSYYNIDNTEKKLIDYLSESKIEKSYGVAWKWVDNLLRSFNVKISVFDVEIDVEFSLESLIENFLKKDQIYILDKQYGEVVNYDQQIIPKVQLLYQADVHVFYKQFYDPTSTHEQNEGGQWEVFSMGWEIPISKTGVFVSFLYGHNRTPLVQSEPVRIALKKLSSYNIIQKNTRENLISRQSNIRKDYIGNSSERMIIYIEEAFYYIPIHIASQLQKRGHYDEALDWFSLVYHYNAPKAGRKIYHGLTEEEDIKGSLSRKGNWLLDPLNPHSIAETRANTYTRYTLLRIIRCLLDYANAEFTRDTLESLPRARTLYQTALKLLQEPEVVLQGDDCELLVSEAKEKVQARITQQYQAVWDQVASDLKSLGNRAVLERTTQAVVAEINDNPDTRAGLVNSRQLVGAALNERAPSMKIAERFQHQNHLLARAHRTLIGMPVVEAAVQQATRTGNGATAPITTTATESTGNGEAAGTTTNNNTVEVNLPAFGFCVPDNPVLFAWQLEANLNLYKLQSCRNIEGLERPLTVTNEALSVDILPFIGASGQITVAEPQEPQPTIYRYRALLDRAKQLANTAQQMEASFLSALEKRDAELYQLLKAGQDVELTREGVRLNSLKIREAKNGITLAELQKDRAHIQESYYSGLIEVGKTSLEEAAEAMEYTAKISYALASLAETTNTFMKWLLGGSTGKFLSLSAKRSEVAAKILQKKAAFQRRKEEWKFSLNLARQDIRIGNQQIRLAKDRLRIVNQEHQISELQSDHAKETLDFLVNKFTNADLYDWMSSILEGVYSTFLQQATAIAKLAQQQLAFEKQEGNLSFIQSDYWENLLSLEDSFAREGERPDRRGLTGSARLLQDITLLDQYAMTTDRRRQQLTKVLSLAQLMPVEFHRFRTTGALSFHTLLKWFDEDFPGHYMRQIKRVRVSVIALNPTIDGIKASLTNDGASWIVTGEPSFKSIDLKPRPETIFFTSAIDATGQFEFELQQQNEQLRPFEGVGVETSWIFKMPKSSNPSLDYNTIADILITLDYTALHSEDYQKRVVQELDDTFSADRTFSFRNEFPDQWYDFNHPDLLAEEDRMKVRFETVPADFPTNLDNLQIKELLLYFVNEVGLPSMAVILGLEEFVATSRMARNGKVSSESGANLERWQPFFGQSPVGNWTLALPDNDDVNEQFTTQQIQDILFVITYQGEINWDDQLE